MFLLSTTSGAIALDGFPRQSGEVAPVLAVPGVSASGSEERASGGLPNPKGLGGSPCIGTVVGLWRMACEYNKVQ
ncbi:hypothetical protein BV375_34680 [Nostoc sp. 106C]|nr:hypothetical protein BV375_34680 [Nostoc sp. 106C]